jgi:hypothetical protein
MVLYLSAACQIAWHQIHEQHVRTVKLEIEHLMHTEGNILIMTI